MALLKFGVKDMIVMSLCTALIIVPYFLMMHTPTAVFIQNATPSRLVDILQKNVDEGRMFFPKDVLTRSNETSVEDEIPGLDEVLKKVPKDVTRSNETSVEDEIPGLDEVLKKVPKEVTRSNETSVEDEIPGLDEVLKKVPKDVTRSNETSVEDEIPGLDEVLKKVPKDVTRSNETSVEDEIPGLDEVLKKAAMPNKTILITTLNSAWAKEDSMIDLFLGSFHQGEGIAHYLDYLLIVAFDQPAYDRCRAIHQHCFRLETEGVDFAAEKFFMTGDFLKMMWRRVEFLRIVLELGYDFLFSDADIMWFRDPFPQFSPDADFQIACDHFNGNSTDISNPPNTGFVYVRSNERTIEFYRYWFAACSRHVNQNDQGVFNYIKHDRQFRAFQLKLKFLETAYFGGFCEVSQDFEKVCTMHANCCTGLERKLNDLRLTISDWRQYKSFTPEEKKERRLFWQAPKECLHSW